MSRAKKPIIIVTIVVGVILLVLIIAPFFINADQFRPQIEATLSQKLGRNVQLGHISVSLFSGSLTADQISIADDPTYSSQPFLTAKSFSVGIDVMPLIFSRDLRVHSLNFNDPQVQLLRTAAGQWNFASLGASSPAPHAKHADEPSVVVPVALNVALDSAQTTAATSSALNSFSVDKMKISNGTVAFGRAGESTHLAYQDVNLSAQNISQTAAFPFQFDAKTPGGGKINLTGNLGPVGNNDGSHLPFEGRSQAENVPAQDIENLLAVLGYSLPAGSSLKGGTIKADLALEGPLDSFVAQGPVQLSGVTLAGFSLASKLSAALGQSASQTGNDTLIKVAEGTLRYGPQGIRADSLNVEIASIGSVTGAGTMSASNALDFRLVAKLEGASPIAKLTQLSLFNKGGGIPFRVEGSASNPQVTADIPGLNKTPLNQLKIPSQGQLGGVLNGLLKKKKPQ
ncbi:MAG: AsmA family protein [Candidatus Acidiferrales bacterium]